MSIKKQNDSKVQGQSLREEDDDVWKNFIKGVAKSLPRARTAHKKRTEKIDPSESITRENTSFAELLDRAETQLSYASKTDSLKTNTKNQAPALDPDGWMRQSLLKLSDVYRAHRDRLVFFDDTQGRQSYPSLDLHHCTEREAFQKLSNFIQAAYKAGDHYVMIITGKSGILHRHVPKWLCVMTAYVRTFQHAPPHQGGEGALIVHLYKKKS